MDRMTDLDTFKNDTKRKNIIRERMSKLIYDKMRTEFTDEFTRYIDREIGITPNCSKVPKNTVVVDVGDVTTKDGFQQGVVVEISVKVKTWNTVELTKSGNTTYAVTLDDYDEKLEKRD